MIKILNIRKVFHASFLDGVQVFWPLEPLLMTRRSLHSWDRFVARSLAPVVTSGLSRSGRPRLPRPRHVPGVGRLAGS